MGYAIEAKVGNVLRRDGQLTRRRILEAALAIFGEKGYRDATHAEICESAGANIAAVNYHFRSKEQLYRAVCAHAISEMAEMFPPDGNVPEGAAPEARLYGHIDAIIRRGRVSGYLRHYHSLRMMETFNSTGLADDLWNEWFTRHHRISSEIIAQLMGVDATQDAVMRCQMSLMSQCYVANASAAAGRFHNVEAAHLQDVAAVIHHIYEFTLAGIRATSEAVETRSPRVCTN